MCNNSAYFVDCPAAHQNIDLRVMQGGFILMDRKSIAPPIFTAANGMQQQIVISAELLDKNSKLQEKILIYSVYWCCEII